MSTKKVHKSFEFVEVVLFSVHAKMLHFSTLMLKFKGPAKSFGYWGLKLLSGIQASDESWGKAHYLRYNLYTKIILMHKSM